ncbi:MAG: methyltransferase domain-containing protein [Actinomycetota bacterium]|nr:methyltransferase domain-containing protein [Actinomycetota bacterium]
MIDLTYRILLDRGVDEAGLRTYLAKTMSGSFDRQEVVQWVLGSSEFETHRHFRGRSSLTPSINASRCRFVRTLPRARQIVDLGGLSLSDERGALVAAGYPYEFDRLVVVDLPSEERHELYRLDEGPSVVETHLGPVTYRYSSMTDLSGIADGSIDLVYSGQSIEHVTRADAEIVLGEARRVLRPGGHLAVDTPNRRITRLYSEEFTDPDHKHEYTWAELRELVERHGFSVVESKGLNYAGRSAASRTFDIDEVAGNCGIYSEVDDCYVLAVTARRE